MSFELTDKNSFPIAQNNWNRCTLFQFKLVECFHSTLSEISHAKSGQRVGPVQINTKRLFVSDKKNESISKVF